MRLEAKKDLHDIQQAADLVAEFTAGKRLADYEADAMLRSISFRNILIHGYAEVDDRIVWDIVESKLPTLRHEVAALQEGG